MPERIRTAEEIEKLTPAEQDQLFKQSIVNDLDDVPADFLARVRARAQERIENTRSRRR